MSLSPAEIRHAELRRGLFGYKRDAVDDLLAETVESFEQVWRERADLADKVEHLEAEVARYRELESLLRTTLVSAERASHELRDQARKEADLIVAEAQSEARRDDARRPRSSASASWSRRPGSGRCSAPRCGDRGGRARARAASASPRPPEAPEISCPGARRYSHPGEGHAGSRAHRGGRSSRRRLAHPGHVGAGTRTRERRDAAPAGRDAVAASPEPQRGRRATPRVRSSSPPTASAPPRRSRGCAGAPAGERRHRPFPRRAARGTPARAGRDGRTSARSIRHAEDEMPLGTHLSGQRRADLRPGAGRDAGGELEQRPRRDRRRARSGSRTAGTAPARTAASRFRRSGWKPCRGRPCASTASAARRSRVTETDAPAASGGRPRRLVDGRAHARLGRRAVARRGSLAVDRPRRGRARGAGRRPADRRRSSRITSRWTRASASPARSRSTTSRTPASRSGCSRAPRAIVIVLTSVAVAWMLVFFARSGARHPAAAGCARARDRRQRLEPDRPHPPRARDRTSSTSATGRRSTLPDSFIVIGVVMLFLILLFTDREPRRRRMTNASTSAFLTRRRVRRLDRFLAWRPEIGSRAAAERLLAAGAVRVDGDVRAKSFKLGGGETVEVDSRRSRRRELTPEHVALTIVHEDPHLLVVDKPAGCRRPSDARAGRRHARPRTARARNRGRRRQTGPGSCTDSTATHRGCSSSRVLQEAHQAMQMLVRRRALEREYLALVRGHPRSKRGRIEAPIGRDRHDPTRHSSTRPRRATR